MWYVYNKDAKKYFLFTVYIYKVVMCMSILVIIKLMK